MEDMSRKELKETLEKQLQLLSERSAGIKNPACGELEELTKSMCMLAETIIRIFPNLP